MIYILIPLTSSALFTQQNIVGFDWPSVHVAGVYTGRTMHVCKKRKEEERKEKMPFEKKGMTLSQESASPVFLACTSALLGIAEPKRRSVSCKQVAKAWSTRPPTGQQPTKRTGRSNRLQLPGSTRGKTRSGRNKIWECQRKHWD